MSWLTGDELTQLRAEALGLLPDTCVIQRATVTVSSAGHAGESWAAVGTAACRLDPFQRQDTAGMVAMREANRAHFRLTLPYDANVADGDRVQCAGETLEILQLHEAHTARIVTRALVARVAG